MSSPTMVSLRDLGNWSGGNTPSKANPAYWTDGTVPWVSPKDMKFDEIASSIDLITKQALDDGRVSLLPSGSVLFVTRSGILAHTFPVAVTNLAVTINQDLKALVPKKGVSSKYVAHAMRGVSWRILKECAKHGTTVASIDTNALLNFKIPMVDLDAQHRIVGEIEKQFSRLDEAVANLKRVKANLKRYKAAVLKAAVEGRLVPTEAELARKDGRTCESGSNLTKQILSTRQSLWKGKGTYKVPALPDETKLPIAPIGWTWVTVEALAFVTKLAGFEYTKYVKYDERGDLAVIKAENAGPEGFKRTEFSRICSDTVSQLTRSQLKPGDLLMVFVGAGTGKVACVPDDQPYFLGPNISMIRIETAFADSKYLEHYLRSPLGYSLALGLAKAVAQPSLSMGTIRTIPVALPPITEQHRIVAEIERRFSLARGVEAQTETNLRRAERMRQATLAKLFAAPVGIFAEEEAA